MKIAFVIWSAISVLYLFIGIFSMRSKKAVNFFANVETAKNIYIDSWDANNIRVQKRGDSNWEERSRLQLRAARNCNRLLALIGIAKSSFHLKSKRVKYWVGKVLKIRGMIRNWNESDSERYAVKQRK